MIRGGIHDQPPFFTSSCSSSDASSQLKRGQCSERMLVQCQRCKASVCIYDPTLFTSSCSVLICPGNSNGASVLSVAHAMQAMQGQSVAASMTSPFLTNSGSAGTCPVKSTGANIPNGCSCNAGCAGPLAASTTSPFFTSPRSAVLGPANADGSAVPGVGSCNSGYAGSAIAITTSSL